MNTPLAPMHIGTMLACYVSPDPEGFFGHSPWNSDASSDVRRWLFNNGLIDADNQATQKGEAWVKAICATPLPEQVWASPPLQHDHEYLEVPYGKGRRTICWKCGQEQGVGWRHGASVG